jgi:glycosyltransferase involved in cell wall biosynthesis
MKVLYHVSMPPSAMANCDAVIQEIESIRKLVSGTICHLYPTRTPGTRFPRHLWGVQHLGHIMQADRSVDLHHIFNPDPFSFLILRCMHRPIIYTVVTGITALQRDAVLKLSRHTSKIIVQTDSQLSTLNHWEVKGAAMVKPGIQTSRFSTTYPSISAPPTLFMGSAPWSEAQFRSKGVEALLDFAKARPEIHLIFLWRGVLEAQMRQRVAAAGLQDRVEIITEEADVNQVLARAHAGVALAAETTLIKAYPHSLLESLAAGKPVLLSNTIPMSADVERLGCGIVVDQIDVNTITQAVDTLFKDYASYAQAAQHARQIVIDQDQMAQAYLALYYEVLRK